MDKNTKERDNKYQCRNNHFIGKPITHTDRYYHDNLKKYSSNKEERNHQPS
ncbi:hypothetical protein [Pasteuria penetrans]|uniref:hypothetical protein n=1 Tax=Pasteuria penetrans TaxID=86005 RepID=UPI001CAA6906|nr:hypothetical protein [Pasteuria penetrans]